MVTLLSYTIQVMVSNLRLHSSLHMIWFIKMGWFTHSNWLFVRVHSIRLCITRCTFFMVLCLCSFRQCLLHVVLYVYGRSSVYLSSSSLQNIAARMTFIPAGPSHYFCGMISVTLYSMMWDLMVLRARPMLFLHVYFWDLLFSLSLLSLYGFVL